MKRPKKPYYHEFLESDDPEIRRLALELEREREAGIIKDPVTRRKDVRNLEDLARFVFWRVELSGRKHFLFEDGLLRRLVWFGSGYSGNIVKLVCEIAPNLPDRNVLRELRLVTTDVSESEIKNLQKAFPLAKISIITEDQDKAEWRWTHAAFPEDPISN